MRTRGIWLQAIKAGFERNCTAKTLKSSVLKSVSIPFVLEPPEYRWPTWRSVGLRLVDRGRVFIQQVGTVILCASLVIWALTYLPLHHGQPPQLEQSAIARLGHFIEPVIQTLGFNWKNLGGSIS